MLASAADLLRFPKLTGEHYIPLFLAPVAPPFRDTSVRAHVPSTMWTPLELHAGAFLGCKIASEVGIIGLGTLQILLDRYNATVAQWQFGGVLRWLSEQTGKRSSLTIIQIV